MDIITLDFETYYSKEFSLSKITTEEYIRDQKFQIIGLGVKFNDHETHWYTHDKVDKAIEKIRGVADKVAILCHNTAFDGAILSWRYGIKPKLWLDTMSMARPHDNMTVGASLKALAVRYELGVKGTEVVDALGKRLEDFTSQELAAYGAYCMNDVNLTYSLFKVLMRKTPKTELRVIDTTLRMYTQPMIELDEAVLKQHYNDVLAKKEALLSRLGGGDRAREILMSNDKFAMLLARAGVEPPTKVSLRTGKQTYAFAKTDKEFTALLEHPNPVVATLVEARLGTKSTIEQTRTERLLGVAQRGALPIMLNYYGAHTGRFSGGEKLNLQNFPRGGALRKALRAPKGYKLIACDSSQIEARMVAYIAGQDDLVQAFAEGRDVYSEFATEIYGRVVTKADKVDRFVGKSCILGLGYSMGGPKLKGTLEIGQGGISVKVTENEATHYVNVYRNKNHRIKALWDRAGVALTDMLGGKSGEFGKVLKYSAAGIELPNGLLIQYPALKRDANGFMYLSEARLARKHAKGEVVPVKDWTRIYGGKVVENVTQALARIVIAEQMVEISKRYQVVFQVHDEIIILAPEDRAEEALADIMAVMSTAPSWAPGLPVACEGDIGDNYGECK